MKKIAIVALLSAFSATPALAADVYVGGHLSLNNLNSPGFSSSTGFGVLGGYTINENIAAEVSYTTLGSPTTSVDTTATWSGSAVRAAAVFAMPVAKDIAVMGKLGLASSTLTGTVSSVSVSSSVSGLSYGVGAKYNLNKELGLTVNYDSVSFGDSSSTTAASMISFGAVYKL